MSFELNFLQWTPWERDSRVVESPLFYEVGLRILQIAMNHIHSWIEQKFQFIMKKVKRQKSVEAKKLTLA